MKVQQMGAAQPTSVQLEAFQRDQRMTCVLPSRLATLLLAESLVGNSRRAGLNDQPRADMYLAFELIPKARSACSRAKTLHGPRMR
jgi:hypothetical protein